MWGDTPVSDLTALKVAISPVEKFREFLATKSQRLTQERQAIVDEVFADHAHFDAEDLIDRLVRRQGAKRVSRASVYRSLTLLEEAGMLRKVTRSNGRDVYEHAYGYPQHDHMICEKCGALIEFPSEAISEILDRVTSEHGFRMTSHKLEVAGICSRCNRPPQRRHRKLDMV